MDTVDKATRSRYMAACKSRGNRSTERRMVRLLREHGITGWRRQFPIKGTPDFCWPKRRVVLFVDGCFWHGCPRCRKTPRSNIPFWLAKVAANRRHDRRVNTVLRRKGWKVIRVWECRIRDARTLTRVRRAVAGRKTRRRQPKR